MSSDKSVSKGVEGVVDTDTDTECVELDLGTVIKKKGLSKTKVKSNPLPVVPKSDQDTILDSICSLLVKCVKLQFKSSTS